MSDAGESLRLFVAVAVPPQVRAAVAAAAAPLRSLAADVGADLRWTDPSTWHVTLAFLGRTDAALVDPLVGALRSVAADAAPFGLRLCRVAGRNARGGVLWVELEPSPALAVLTASVRVALDGLGFGGEDRPYRPHLTLARSRTRASVPRPVADAYDGPAGAWSVHAIELMRSHLGRSGARYETVAMCALGPPA